MLDATALNHDPITRYLESMIDMTSGASNGVGMLGARRTTRLCPNTIVLLADKRTCVTKGGIYSGDL